jgi:uncharacterized membrane-anchored protein
MAQGGWYDGIHSISDRRQGGLMNRLTGAVSLSLLLFGFAMHASAEASTPGPSASGTIKDAPASSASIQSAPASASAAASVDASTPAAPMSSASASSSAPVASAYTASAPTTPAIITAAPSVPATTTAPLNWKAGPRDVALLDQAVIKIPQGYAYLEQDDARQFLRKLGNPNADDVIGALTGPGGNWLIVVRFNKVGYVRDEAPEWKLDELRATLRKNVEQTNAIRKKNGVGETEIVGWIEKPSYDSKRHRLIWAISSHEKGAKHSDFQSVNFNVDSLGREGYFNFNLVTDLAQLEQNKKFASVVASSIIYNGGKKYADFKKGSDKTSTYNIVDLVAGSETAASGEKTETDAASNDSKAVRFFKIFGSIVAGMLGLAGAGFGVYYLLGKRRAAKKVEATPPEGEAESEAPPPK